VQGFALLLSVSKTVIGNKSFDVFVAMTTADLLTTIATVTSSLKSCLPVQVPIETGGSVSTVTLALTAAVGITVGVLGAFTVGWLVFRQCIGKVCSMLLHVFLRSNEVSP